MLLCQMTSLGGLEVTKSVSGKWELAVTIRARREQCYPTTMYHFESHS